MKCIFIFVIMSYLSYGQEITGTYSNYKPANNNEWDPLINEITINPDNTFEFWSRPY